MNENEECCCGIIIIFFLVMYPLFLYDLGGWPLTILGIFFPLIIFITYTNYSANKKRNKRRAEYEKRRAEYERKRRYEEEQKKRDLRYEEEQREKGLIKFIGSDGQERWGTPEQVKKWREIDIGLSNNFADYSPYEFEKFIAELFSRMGYKTEVTSKVKDYGVDVVAKKGENTVAIQVKKFSKGNNVGAKEVQQILGAMWKVKADQSIIITTTGFTVYAREQAKEAPVELWDKKRLHEMVRRYFIDIDT